MDKDMSLRYRTPDSESTRRMQELRDKGALNKLTPRQRAAIEMRFGLGDEPPYTLQGIGTVMNVTRERVRQILNEALEQIDVDPWG